MTNRILLIFCCLALFFSSAFAKNFTPFQGKINAESINIRCSSTINAEVISKANKGEEVAVVSQAFEWYKIQLPKNAAIFVKKEFLVPLNEKSTSAITTAPLNPPEPLAAKVQKDNVNIRLSPSEKSTIIGRLNQNQVVTIISTTGDWAKILPVSNSYGWVNKKFVDKVPEIIPQAVAQSHPEKITPAQNTLSEKTTEITVKGKIAPYGKVFNRTATHKLISQDGNTFLLKGDKNSLNKLNYSQVKVTGKLYPAIKPNQNLPVIEIEKMEVLD